MIKDVQGMTKRKRVLECLHYVIEIKRLFGILKSLIRSRNIMFVIVAIVLYVKLLINVRSNRIYVSVVIIYSTVSSNSLQTLLRNI